MGDLPPGPSFTERLAFALLVCDDARWFLAARNFASFISVLQRVSPAKIERRLGGKGVALTQIADGHHPTIKLPFLWVYGRRDSTISIMGANIYPEDLEECVYVDPLLAQQISSFCMELAESDAADVQACFHFEVANPDDGLRDQIADSVYETLIRLNADFREAAKEHPNALRPQVRLHRTNEGPFAANSNRIKHLRKVRA
ncbi:MAG: hypothetical protein ACYC96_04700 [Fimbriimonadaceae bacterium]